MHESLLLRRLGGAHASGGLLGDAHGLSQLLDPGDAQPVVLLKLVGEAVETFDHGVETGGEKSDLLTKVGPLLTRLNAASTSAFFSCSDLFFRTTLCDVYS